MTVPAKPNSRDKIADAAADEFAAKGYAGARVARIADTAGVNKQLIFYYFGSKAGLYGAVLGEGRSDPSTGSASSAAAPATDRLRQAVGSLYRELALRPAFVAALFDRGNLQDAAVVSMRDTVGELTRNLRAVASDGQGLGFFRDDADPDRTVRTAFLLCAAYLRIAPVLNENGRDSADAWTAHVSDLLLKGLAW